MMKENKDAYKFGHSGAEHVDELEAKNENLVALVEKLLIDSSRYENSLFAIKNSQARLLATNKKLCGTVKHLQDKLRAYTSKQKRIDGLAQFLKDMALGCGSGDVVLSQATLKKVFEAVEARSYKLGGDALLHRQMKPHLNESFLYTI